MLCLLGAYGNARIELGKVNEPGSFMRLVTGLEIWFRSTGIFTLRRNRSLFGLLLFGVLLLQLNVTRLILMPLSWKVQTR